MASPVRETRIHGSLLAAAEKRLLVRMAGAIPAPINADHLTVLGGGAMAAAGVCYALGDRFPLALVLAVACLAVNWFGDSLDGTLARVRHHERPRYGFYVDHVLDAIGVLFVVGGLFLGGFTTLLPAAAFLLAYYLLNVEIALATHAIGTFRISYWKLGPTELRLLLAAGTLQLLNSPWSTIAGYRILLFDIGLGIGAIGLFVTFVVAAVRNIRKLYVMEPLPPEGGSHESAMRKREIRIDSRGFRLQAEGQR